MPSPNAVTEPGVRAPAAPGEAQHLQAALAGELVELAGEERRRLKRSTRIASPGCVVEALGQRAQRRDADAGADQRDLATGARPGAEPAVRTFDEHAGAGPEPGGSRRCRRRRPER